MMLKNGLMDASENHADFFMRKLCPFQNAVNVKQDSVFNSLIEISEEYDHYCIDILAVI